MFLCSWFIHADWLHLCLFIWIHLMHFTFHVFTKLWKKPLNANPFHPSLAEFFPITCEDITPWEQGIFGPQYQPIRALDWKQPTNHRSGNRKLKDTFSECWNLVLSCLILMSLWLGRLMIKNKKSFYFIIIMLRL